jgi:hypothetical protein
MMKSGAVCPLGLLCREEVPMSSVRFSRSFSLALALGALTLVAGAQAAVDPAAVKVEYVHPEKFKDVGDGFHGGPQVRDGYLDALNWHLRQDLARTLGAGQNVEVAITQVDMAGEFELWHPGGGDDLRIIRDVYPARINLHFWLTDASGSIIRQGDRKLSNLGFTDNIAPYQEDPLRYEKALLDTWVAREFSAAQ